MISSKRLTLGAAFWWWFAVAKKCQRVRSGETENTVQLHIEPKLKLLLYNWIRHFFGVWFLSMVKMVLLLLLFYVVHLKHGNFLFTHIDNISSIRLKWYERQAKFTHTNFTREKNKNCVVRARKRDTHTDRPHTIAIHITQSTSYIERRNAKIDERWEWTKWKNEEEWTNELA